MPKENKSTSRRSRRLSGELDNEIATCLHESMKSSVGSNRYSPFFREASKRDSRTIKENMIASSNAISGGIIENGIKYIMFPLHLLRFCIFGTTSSAPTDSKESITEKSSEKKDEETDKKKKEKSEWKKENLKDDTSKTRMSSKGCQSPKSSSRPTDKSRDVPVVKQTPKHEDKNDSEESTDEMVTAEEDSDSCAEQWSSANSTMIQNRLVDCNRFNRPTTNTVEEPMDISIDEQALEKTYSVVKVSRDCQQPYIRDQEQYNNLSIDEEIARIFQKQCTSSEDELPSSSCYKKTRKTNFLRNEFYDKYSPTIPRSKKNIEDNDMERRKKTLTESVANNKRRKVAHEEDRSDRHAERKSENKMREGKRNSPQDSPSKYKSRSSRIPSRSSVKYRESKGRDIKYKETATQTDSAFSDDDVEMTPVDMKLVEKQLYYKPTPRRSEINHFQRREMEQELFYIADNEDSNDEIVRNVHKRVSSCSTSSSSTDLGFEDRASAPSDTDIAKGRRNTYSPDNISAFRACTRAPPGFPKEPQNPPLTSYHSRNSKHFALPYSKDKNSSANVPPAPSPLRHLYYNYPEFMDLPVNVKSPKIVNNILRQNYPR